jgi:inorganic pyrophosphatase
MNPAKEVMELDQVYCQTDDQVIFKGILERLRLGWMNEQDEARLRVLTLDDNHYTSKEIKDISDGALHLFTRYQAKMHTTNKNYARQ